MDFIISRHKPIFSPRYKQRLNNAPDFLQLEIIAVRNAYNNSYASLDEFEYHDRISTDNCTLEPPAADPDSCGDDQFLCRGDKTCIPIVSFKNSNSIIGFPGNLIV